MHVTSFVVQAEGYEPKTLEWVVLAQDLWARTSDETRKHRRWRRQARNIFGNKGPTITHVKVGHLRMAPTKAKTYLC